jgi:hypothetical protein
MRVDEGAQLHHMPAVAAYLQTANVVGLAAKRAVGLHEYGERMVERRELVHVAGADVILQQVEHIADRHLQRLGLGPIEREFDGRHRRAKRAEHALQFGPLRDVGDQRSVASCKAADSFASRP